MKRMASWYPFWGLMFPLWGISCPSDLVSCSFKSRALPNGSPGRGVSP